MASDPMSEITVERIDQMVAALRDITGRTSQFCPALTVLLEQSHADLATLARTLLMERNEANRERFFGYWCSKCRFLTNRPDFECPNDGTPLALRTWKAEAMENVAQLVALRAENERLRGVLEKIADDPHNSYEVNRGGQYGIGVTDGHRCAAQTARAALKEPTDAR